MAEEQTPTPRPVRPYGLTVTPLAEQGKPAQPADLIAYYTSEEDREAAMIAYMRSAKGGLPYVAVFTTITIDGS